MPGPVAVEVRRLAVDATLKKVGTLEEVAEWFQVSTASLKRWRRQLRETGSLEPDRSPRRRPELGEEENAVLISILEASPDLTLDELAEEVGRRTGVFVSSRTMSRQLNRLKITRKKNRLRG